MVILPLKLSSLLIQILLWQDGDVDPEKICIIGLNWLFLVLEVCNKTIGLFAQDYYA